MKTDQDILLDSTSSVEEKRAALAAIMAKQIIDGWRKGMKDSIFIARNQQNFEVDQTAQAQSWNMACEACARAILAARDNKKETP